MKQITSLFLFLFCLNFYSYSQKYSLNNEKLIFSFQTNTGKIITLCSEKTGKYLIYRFGRKANIQLEFPKSKDKLSWQKFEYSYWLRGGGVQNEGMDVNYVAFTIDKRSI